MEKYNEKAYLLIGLIMLIFGIVILIGSVNLYISVANIVLILMVLITIKDLFSLLIKKPKLDIKLLSKVFNVFLAFLAYSFSEYAIAIVPIIFSIYAILNAIVYIINFVIIKLNKSKGGFKELFKGLLYLTIGITFLFSPIVHLNDLLTILGIYSILLGFTFIIDYLEINHYFRLFKFRISLPSIIEALIPFGVLQRINKIINEEEYIKEEYNKKEEKTDLEIIIHVTNAGYGRLGHMDICYKGEVISFGNYDKDTRKFYQLFGSGVIFTTYNKNDYIKFSIKDQKKTLFIFGLKLTDKEQKKIEHNIEKIKEELKPWEPTFVKEKSFFKKNKKVDYSARLYKATRAKFYKFKRTKYRMYFILGNNCVTMANRIINKALKDSFKFYGVMTPGTYYDYLQREYLKKNSKVVSKKIYSKNNINKI